MSKSMVLLITIFALWVVLILVKKSDKQAGKAGNTTIDAGLRA